MDELTNLSTARMPDTEQLAAMMANIKMVVDAFAGIVEAVSAGTRGLVDFVRVAERVHRRQYPNAVPLSASPWRERQERRRYGRVQTYDERRERWRAMWGGLCSPS